MAFLVPIFEKLLKDADKLVPEDIKALIITPTRELAHQIYKVAVKFNESVASIGVKCSFGKAGNSLEEYTKDGQNILVKNF